MFDRDNEIPCHLVTLSGPYYKLAGGQDSTWSSLNFAPSARSFFFFGWGSKADSSSSRKKAGVCSPGQKLETWGGAPSLLDQDLGA